MDILSRPFSLMPDDFDIMDVLVVVAGFLTLAVLVQIVVLVLNTDTFKQSVLYSYTKFCYASFLKPHANTSEEGGNSQPSNRFMQRRCGNSQLVTGMILNGCRQLFMMRIDKDSCVAGRNCLALWQPS